MHGFLLRIIQRRLRRLALGTAFGMALVASSAVATSRLHDPGSNDAALSVEKARILVCGAPGRQTTANCEEELREALDALTRDRSVITAGGDVSRD